MENKDKAYEWLDDRHKVELVSNIIAVIVVLLIVGCVVLAHYNKSAEINQSERDSAISMRELSDSVLVSELLLRKEIAGPSSSVVDYWTNYSKSLDQFTRKEASVIAGVLCDIYQYSCHKRTEYKLLETQQLNMEQINFFVSKGYTVDAENGIIRW